MIFSFNAREQICINGAAKYRSAMILQCRNYKSERIIYRGSVRPGSALRARNTDRHYEFCVFRPPPIFRMRPIYEYVTKSRGKPSWTWRVVFRSRGKGGFALAGRCAILLAASQLFRAILLRALDAHVVALSLAQLRRAGKYCGSSVNSSERFQSNFRILSRKSGETC